MIFALVITLLFWTSAAVDLNQRAGLDEDIADRSQRTGLAEDLTNRNQQAGVAEDYVDRNQRAGLVEVLVNRNQRADVGQEPIDGSQRAGLAEDLAELQNLIPFGSIRSAATINFIFNSDFRNFLYFIKGEETKAAQTLVLEHKQVKEIVDFLKSRGVDTEEKISEIMDLLGFSQIPNALLKRRRHFRSCSVKEIVDEMMDLIPFDKLQSLYKQKLETSPAFKELNDKIAAINYEELSEFVQNSKELSEWIAKIRSFNVDLNQYMQKMREAFGWK